MAIGSTLASMYFFIEPTFPNLSNSITLVVEIGVGIVIALIVFRYTKESEKQNQKRLNEIRDLEESSGEIIKDMKLLLEKLAQVIKEQERTEKFRRIEVLQGIQSNLTLSKGSLSYIDKMQKDGFQSSPSVKDEYERMKRFSSSLDDSLASNYYWIGKLTVQISNVNNAINNYAISQIFYDSELTSIEQIRDRIEEIIRKVITLKEDIRKQN